MKNSAKPELTPADPLATAVPMPGRLLFNRQPHRYLDLSKDTQFSDAWLVMGLLLIAVGTALSNQFLTASALVLFSVAAVSWLWNELSLVGLQYERQLSMKRAFLGENVELSLSVYNGKPLPLTWLTVTDVFPTELQIDGADVITNMATNLGEFHTFWMVGPFQRSRRHFTIQCNRRGFHHFGPARLNTGDGFGFFTTAASLAPVMRLVVYPRLYSVAELRLPRKNPFGAQGARNQLLEDPLRTMGIREWQASDSPQRVHWKATARHQQLLSRVYEPSTEHQVILFLNAATLKRHWLGSIPELFERAISVTGSLAELAIGQRMPVGLITNGVLPASDQPLRLLPGRSPDQLLRILEMLAAVTPFTTQSIEDLLMLQAPRLPWGATVVVVTAIAYRELVETLLHLADSGRQVVLFTLAERPPDSHLPGITVYHLPHLVDDLIAPQEVKG